MLYLRATSPGALSTFEDRFPPTALSLMIAVIRLPCPCLDRMDPPLTARPLIS